MSPVTTVSLPPMVGWGLFYGSDDNLLVWNTSWPFGVTFQQICHIWVYFVEKQLTSCIFDEVHPGCDKFVEMLPQMVMMCFILVSYHQSRKIGPIRPLVVMLRSLQVSRPRRGCTSSIIELWPRFKGRREKTPLQFFVHGWVIISQGVTIKIQTDIRYRNIRLFIGLSDRPRSQL